MREINKEIERFKNIYAKAKLLGMPITYLNGVKSADEEIEGILMISLNDDDHLLYVPDNIVKPNLKHTLVMSTIDFMNFTGKVKVIGGRSLVNLDNMFCHTKFNQIDLSDFSIFNGKINSLYNTFYNCAATEIIGLEELNAENLTSIENTFRQTVIETIDLTKWSTPKLQTVLGAFEACKARKIYANNLDVSNVENLTRAFSNIALNELDLSNWDTKQVRLMAKTFSESTINNLNLKNWNTSNILDYNLAFFRFNCSEVLDITSFSFRERARLDDMFDGANIPRLKINIYAKELETFELRGLYKKFNGKIDCLK